MTIGLIQILYEKVISYETLICYWHSDFLP